MVSSAAHEEASLGQQFRACSRRIRVASWKLTARTLLLSAESERERRAKIINAKGELQACGKTRGGGLDDSRATNRPATALVADDEGNFERASHNDHFACATCFEEYRRQRLLTSGSSSGVS